jgi:hypothetical protein
MEKGAKMENYTLQDLGRMFGERDYKGLIQALKFKENAQVRASAAEKLGMIGFYSGDIIKALEEAQKDGDPGVRKAAERSRNDLLSVLNGLERVRAMQGLGKLKMDRNTVIDLRKR